MRVFGRRYGQVDVAIGTDRVLFGFPIPQNGSLNNVWFNVHLIGTEGMSYRNVAMYGLSGFVMPVPDPDAEISYTDLWDLLVPKDEAFAEGGFDLDTVAADTAPEFELGEIDTHGIFDMSGNDPLEIYRRRKLMSVASTPIGYEKVAAGTDVFTPVDVVSGKVGRKVNVSSPSVVSFGVSSPSMDSSQSPDQKTPKESEWMLLQYLEVALENMFMYLTGLVETGAESPYEESSQFIAKLLEDTFIEQAASAFDTTIWRCFYQATFDISVPGTVAMKQLSSE